MTIHLCGASTSYTSKSSSARIKAAHKPGSPLRPCAVAPGRVRACSETLPRCPTRRGCADRAWPSKAHGSRCLHRRCVLRGEVDTGCQVESWGLLQRLDRHMIVVSNNGRSGVYPSGVTASTTPYRDTHTPRHTEGWWSRETYSREPFTIVTP